MENISFGVGCADKPEREYVNRFNIILPAFITLLALSVIITKLLVISEMKRIDQKISDLINIKMKQYVKPSIK